jgi:peptidoglycan/LPS O-acetylase OafA/YrhL
MHVTSKGHIIQLDGIRFIAVALVLFAHLTDTNLPAGELGVTMFFVLSGFLITRILMLSRDKFQNEPGGFRKYLRKFLIRRTIRIFPVYYLCIFILYIIGVPSVREYLGWLVLYATNIYMAVHEGWMGSVDHLWSLAVEEQVYLIFPFLIFFVPRKNLLTVLGLMGLFSVLLRLYFFMTGKSWIVSYVSMPACLDSFAFGGFMAWLQLNKKEAFTQLFSRKWLVVASLLVWLLTYYFSVQLGLKYDPVNKYNVIKIVFDRLSASAFSFFLIGSAAVGYGGGMAIFLENKAVVYLGRISYGIYLYHNFIFNHYHSYTVPNHPVVRLFNKVYRHFPELQGIQAFQVTVVCILTVLVASLSWHFFEKPINALKDKYAY